MTADRNVRRKSLRRSTREYFIAAEDGSALLELSLLLPVIIAIILAATELAMYTQRSIIVVEAASIGARFGIIAGNGTNTTGMTQAAQNASENLRGFSVNATSFCSCSPGGAQVSCTSSCPSLVAMSHYVRVTTSATIPGVFQVAGLPTSLHPTATSTMRASYAGQ